MFSKFTEDSVYRATGWSWAPVFGRSPLVRAAIQHPFGITVLALSLLLALAMMLVPAMEVWSGWAPWVLAWGVLCYGASVMAVSRTRPTPREPELRQLEAVRRMIRAKLSERKAAEGWSRSAVTRILEDAHENLERRIIPAMGELLALQGDLTRSLKDFEDGSVPLPEKPVLDRLKMLHSRRKATIEECVVQAANAAATLIALLQEREETTVADEAEGWAQELLDTYEAIREAMRIRPVDITPPIDDDSPGTVPQPVPFTQAPEQVQRVYSALELALKRLNRPPQLSKCELMELLPGLIDQRWKLMSEGSVAAPAPLERAQALREVIVGEIELLKPAGDTVRGSDPAAEHYIILYMQYVLGRSVNEVIARLHVSEAGYYRRRREAVEALTHDLIEKEEAAA
ncbi:MAG: hypothetical protein O3B04_10305 [Chloroflexi bacterium]|nr:hypothetical protein [Chloroflexota bacterium]